MRKHLLPLSIIALTFLFSIIVYPSLPNEVASHWGTNGEVDGYMSKLWGAFFLPILLLGLYFLLTFLPNIDPKKENYKKFAGTYNLIILLFVIFLAMLHVGVLLFNLGMNINIAMIVPIAVGVLFIILGNYMPKFKHNYFVGIKTPWTLANEKVWAKTHRFGGKVFIVMGLILIFSAFFNGTAQFIVLLSVTFGGVFLLFLMSYIYFKKETK
ncbi:hypothetical protein CIB95_09520 [Lottiidibacillus patelloidae]|uniref:DUF1648 domain-containing protein n=1 Tax=Lottiidibacillus patelloidae TaxID=2670334 RepID=A0A263BTG7_9BACI|nr:SdpI family protein [Lottiidibacillus patelloidae]OZM56999.1 hypothetical protein CIB95_09520 [Lottiidibacillus patelloidae]